MPPPDRWDAYCPMGTVIPGTKFIAFKVPLKEALLRAVDEKDRFSPTILMTKLREQNLALAGVIDLTFTWKYYDKKEFLDQSVEHKKVFTKGHEVPSDAVYKEFIEAVESFDNDENLVGVHCTHGVNRTGYLICRYMIEKLDMNPQEAIDLFNTARCHNMERENYISDLKNRKRGEPSDFSDIADKPEKIKKPRWRHHKEDHPNWRKREEDHPNWRHHKEDPPNWRHREQDHPNLRDRNPPHIRNHNGFPPPDKSRDWNLRQPQRFQQDMEPNWSSPNLNFPQHSRRNQHYAYDAQHYRDYGGLRQHSYGRDGKTVNHDIQREAWSAPSFNHHTNMDDRAANGRYERPGSGPVFNHHNGYNYHGQQRHMHQTNCGDVDRHYDTRYSSRYPQQQQPQRFHRPY